MKAETDDQKSSTQPKAILNAYCQERQKKALEIRAKSKASGIDSKRAEQQAQYILKNYSKSESKPYRGNMITVLLINTNAQVHVLKYRASSVKDAVKLLIADWAAGKIVWEYDGTNEAFSKEWFVENGMEPLSDDYMPRFENGVRVLEWYLSTGSHESDDEIVRGYFLHTL